MRARCVQTKSCTWKLQIGYIGGRACLLSLVGRLSLFQRLLSRRFSHGCKQLTRPFVLCRGAEVKFLSFVGRSVLLFWRFNCTGIIQYCLQEYSGDAADLFLDMRESQIQQAAKDKRKQQLAVPGIINPHDRPDEMQE